MKNRESNTHTHTHSRKNTHTLLLSRNPHAPPTGRQSHRRHRQTHPIINAFVCFVSFLFVSQKMCVNSAAASCTTGRFIWTSRVTHCSSAPCKYTIIRQSAHPPPSPRAYRNIKGYLIIFMRRHSRAESAGGNCSFRRASCRRLCSRRRRRRCRRRHISPFICYVRASVCSFRFARQSFRYFGNC